MALRHRVLAGLLAGLLGAGCSTAPRRSARGDFQVMVRGSDTMLVLNRSLAAAFMRENPGVAVLVEGGGSGAGIEALISGDVDICAASRPLRPGELRRLYEATGRLGVRFTLALDPLAIFVHPSNPVAALSLEDLAGLLTGRIRNWSAVGGADLPVVPVVRPPVSGTHGFLADRVLGGEPYAPGAVVLPTTRAVVRRVASDPACLGYGGIAWARGVKLCAIEGIRPGTDPGTLRRYPLTRSLYYYTARPPGGWPGRFVRWCLGPGGQRVIARVGYVPLWPPGPRSDPDDA